MSVEGTITQWIKKAKVGDGEAARQLWERFFDELTALVRGRLNSRTRRVVDEEDIALDAFRSFFDAAQAGRFPRLDNRNELRRLLMSMAVRKAADAHVHEFRKKRGGDFSAATDPAIHLDQVMDKAPTAETAIGVAEEFERVMSVIGDEKLQATAIAKMEGYTNDEIAREQDCATRTVERQLNLIRKKLEAVQND